MPVNTRNELDALLLQAGIDAETADAVTTIDALLQKWRRRAMKRELGHRALVDLGIELDLVQFDVLVAIEGPSSALGDDGEAKGEVMVATVAERVNIDPSRASRLVGDLVDTGYARRAVSQADARRTIIELTELGQSVVAAVRSYKFLIMGDFLGEWDKSELAAFVPMLKRFGTWMDGIDTVAEKHASEVATLTQSVLSAKGKPGS